jgi:predicted RNA-binding protein with PIN domain
MLYYIDGYNLMFRAVRGSGDFKTYRENLIEDLNEKIQILMLDATIVFDAQYQYGIGSRSRYRHLTICFTDTGETADDYLIDEIRSSSTPRQIILVTSDKRLAWRARHYHAKTMSVEEFMETVDTQFKKRVKGEKKKKTSPPAEPQATEPPTVVHEESFNYYLQEFEKRLQSQISPSDKPKEKYKSETDRWLKIFEERSKEKPE